MKEGDVGMLDKGRFVVEGPMVIIVVEEQQDRLAGQSSWRIVVPALTKVRKDSEGEGVFCCWLSVEE